MSDHRIILGEKSDDRHTPDETCIELTVRHGQCNMCSITLYDKDDAFVLTGAHVDSSFFMERYCSTRCLARAYESGRK